MISGTSAPAASPTPPAPAASPARAHRRITPTSGWISLRLDEVWEYRDLLVTLALRDVRLRYRQTALGVLWVVFQPLIAAGIFTFVFNRVAGLQGDGTPYFAFAFAGQVAWQAFAGTLSRSSGSLVQNAGLVSKVFFPRLVLPFSVVVATLVDLAVGLAVVAVLMAFYGLAPFWGLLLLPVWFLLLVTLAMGFGLLCAALMVQFRDVVHIIPVALQFLLYASPVGMALAEITGRLGERWTPVYLALNPLAVLLEGFRWSLFGRSAPPWPYVAYAAGAALVMLLAGAALFRRQERRFADII